MSNVQPSEVEEMHNEKTRFGNRKVEDRDRKT